MLPQTASKLRNLLCTVLFKENRECIVVFKEEDEKTEPSLLMLSVGVEKGELESKNPLECKFLILFCLSLPHQLGFVSIRP